MTGTPRVDPEEARRRVEAGALLICAYTDTAKCERVRLQGAITLPELEERLPSLPPDQDLIFYCA